MVDSYKNIACLAIEKALLEMGSIELDAVNFKLNRDFGLNLSNCIEHPESLKQILCDLYGPAYTDILESIDKSLKEIRMNDELYNFIRVLKS